MNKKALAVLIILLTASLFITQPVFAAWTQPKGHAYNQLTYSYYVTNSKYTTLNIEHDEDLGVDRVTGVGEEKAKVRVAKFTNTALTYYGEYGITDLLTVYVAVPYKWMKSDDVQRYENATGPHGIGDIDTGLRYNLVKNLFGTGVLMSIQGGVKIPEAYEYGDPMDHLSLGDGQYDYTFLLMFGRGLGKGYAHLAAGYVYRDENQEYYTFKPSDKVKVTIGGGYAITSWFSVRALVDYSHSVGNASVSQELIYHAYDTGQARQGIAEHTLIRDTLGLEGSALNVGGSLVFNIAPKMQTVLSYGADIDGIEDWGFGTVDTSVGQIYSIALVYMY